MNKKGQKLKKMAYDDYTATERTNTGCHTKRQPSNVLK